MKIKVMIIKNFPHEFTGFIYMRYQDHHVEPSYIDSYVNGEFHTDFFPIKSFLLYTWYLHGKKFAKAIHKTI